MSHHLFLGDPPDLPGAKRVTSAAEAMDVIGTRGIAVLPEGAWELADEVLWCSGDGLAWRRHQLHWARTGTILKPVPRGMLDEGAEPAPRTSAVDPAWAWLPEIPDALKVDRPEELEPELMVVQVENAHRYTAVRRMAERVVAAGMDPSYALRRALDETAAEDEALDERLAERLAESVKWRPMMPLDELLEGLGEWQDERDDESS